MNLGSLIMTIMNLLFYGVFIHLRPDDKNKKKASRHGCLYGLIGTILVFLMLVQYLI